MARFTSLEFLEALGLSYGDYNGAKILLRLLQKKGIAKEVDRISPTGRGRKMVVYELPEQITIGVKPPDFVPSHPVRKKKPVEDAVTEIEEDEEIVTETEDSYEDETEEEVITQERLRQVLEDSAAEVTASAETEWDYGWDDEDQ